MKRRKKYRILFAAVDIGWRISSYQKFLEGKFGDQIKVESYVKYKVPDDHYRARYTYQIPITSFPTLLQWLLSLGFFVIALFKYSHFYFFSGETLLTRKLRPFELSVYKLLNKKVIFHFVGSDIRDPDYLNWKAEHIREYLQNDKDHRKSKAWQLALIRDSRKYADQIFVSTPDLLEICPSATYFPLIVEIDRMLAELKKAQSKADVFFKTDKLRILHAPSSPKTKGSSILLEVIEKLKSEGSEFEFIYTPELEIESPSAYPVSRYQLFQLYQEADIVVDQMVIGWYGMQSIEALLARCKVICYVDQKLLPYMAPDSPLITTNAIDLENSLRRLIAGEKGNINQKQLIQWIEQEHSLESKGHLLAELFD